MFVSLPIFLIYHWGVSPCSYIYSAKQIKAHTWIYSSGKRSETSRLGGGKNKCWTKLIRFLPTEKEKQINTGVKINDSSFDIKLHRLKPIPVFHWFKKKSFKKLFCANKTKMIVDKQEVAKKGHSRLAISQLSEATCASCVAASCIIAAQWL